MPVNKPSAPEAVRHVVEVADAPPPEVALVRLAASCTRFADVAPVLLHSSGGAPCRWSWLAWEPVRRIEWSGDKAAVWARFTALLGEVVQAAPRNPAIPGPFQGGFLGALSYDLHAPGADLAIDPALPPDDPEEPATPLIVGGIYDQFLVWDHAAKRCLMVTPDAARASELRAVLATPASAAPKPPTQLTFHRETSRAAHSRGVAAVQAAIHAGEIYQANLSHRLRGTLDPALRSPAVAYAALSAANPVPYAGFVEWPGGALLSASPELLVECDPRPAEATADRRARTRPIKGTAPRGATPAQDQALGEALRNSAKDRAELAMIVDLERNDLGRVAAFRADRAPSVFCSEAARLEPYASVWHLVADVECSLRAGCTEAELLAAVFPGGSITGAPKLRSMEVIAELEQRERSFFTGSLGFVDQSGACAFNILIRTLIWNTRTGAASLRVGGGLTWASEALAEDQETLDKAASLLAGLGIALDSTP